MAKRAHAASPSPGKGVWLDNLFDNAAVKLREALVAAQMQVIELVLIEAELVKHGRMKIAKMDRVLDCA
jgi:hypothetical protein